MNAPGWYPDTERPGGIRYWDGQQWSDHPEGRRTADQSPAKRQPRYVLRGAAVIVGLLLLVGIINSADDEPADDPGQPAETTAATFAGTPAGWQVVNPASVEVRFDVANTSDVAGVAQCTVRASDDSGTYEGFDYFTTDRIPAGEQESFRGTLTIENQGAAYVTDMTVDCEAE